MKSFQDVRRTVSFRTTPTQGLVLGLRGRLGSWDLGPIPQESRERETGWVGPDREPLWDLSKRRTTDTEEGLDHGYGEGRTKGPRSRRTPLTSVVLRGTVTLRRPETGSGPGPRGVSSAPSPERTRRFV